jgi:hypothetical protein
MLTALVLVCSLSATPDLGTCNRNNALDVMRLPDQFASSASCAMQGQAYVAQTAIGRNLTDKETVKVICIPSALIDEAQIRVLTGE